MKLVGVISTAALSLILGVAAPVYAQEQHEQQDQQKDEQKDKSVQQDEKRAQQEKTAKPEEGNAQEQDKNAKPEDKTAQQEQRPGGNGGRIPDDRYRANFGREHTFHVSQGDYGNRRFQYGGYWFGFVGPWPANWLYTQDVYVIDINGVYYLCNPAYPGVNIALSVTL